MPAFAEWLAAQDPPNAQAAAFQGAMPFDRLARVNRTTRGETALLTEHRAEPILIKSY
jgi:hypothetical protein